MTDSTTGDLEQRVARAMAIDAWTEKGYSETQVAEWWDTGSNGAVLNKGHYCKRARAALKAHAEWLERNELEIRAKPPFDFTVNLFEETEPAKQEDQHHD